MASDFGKLVGAAYGLHNGKLIELINDEICHLKANKNFLRRRRRKYKLKQLVGISEDMDVWYNYTNGHIKELSEVFKVDKSLIKKYDLIYFLCILMEMNSYLLWARYILNIDYTIKQIKKKGDEITEEERRLLIKLRMVKGLCAIKTPNDIFKKSDIIIYEVTNNLKIYNYY